MSKNEIILKVFADRAVLSEQSTSTLLGSLRHNLISRISNFQLAERHLNAAKRKIFLSNATVLALGALAVFGPLTFLETHYQLSSPVIAGQSEASLASAMVEQELEDSANTRFDSDRNKIVSVRQSQQLGWSTGVQDALVDYTRHMAMVQGQTGLPDADLLAASKLLSSNTVLEQQPLIFAARNALDRAAGRLGGQTGYDFEKAVNLRDSLRVFSNWGIAQADALAKTLTDDVAVNRHALSPLVYGRATLHKHSNAYSKARANAYVAANFLDLMAKNGYEEFTNLGLINDMGRVRDMWQLSAGPGMHNDYLVLISNESTRVQELNNLISTLRVAADQSYKLSKKIDATLRLKGDELWAKSDTAAASATIVAP